MDGYSYLAPSVTYPLPLSPFSLGSTPFSAYGVRALYGTLGSVVQHGAIKPFLLRSISTKNGSFYDENPKLWNAQTNSWERSSTHGTPKHQALEINLNCALSAPTKAEFWRNYNAFLHDLICADNTLTPLSRCKKVLTADNQLIDCYYEGQTVDDFTIFRDAFWVQFTLSMLVLSGLTEDVIKLLAAESGILVITEEGKFIRI